MKSTTLYKFAYSFYKQGNSLEKVYEWWKDTYSATEAATLMHGFIKTYIQKDKQLQEEFNKSCFI